MNKTFVRMIAFIESLKLYCK